MTFVHIQGNPEPVRVGKIICVGRNYADHAREMKAEIPTFPVLFFKPPSAIINDKDKVIIPSISKELHHEVEMTVLIGKSGSKIDMKDAYSYVAGYGVGLDMTLRDIQQEAKTKGLPWALAKGFDTSAPLSDFVPTERIQDPHDLDIQLLVNGQLRQRGNTRDFLFRLDQLIALISTYFSLDAGDIIFTGTPQGVQQVVPGDELQSELRDGSGSLLTSFVVTITG